MNKQAQREENDIYKRIYDIVLSCSFSHTIREFAISICNELQEVCPYDEAMVFFMNGNQEICDQYLVNVSESWSNLYLEYYAQMENFPYRINVCKREKKDCIVLHQRNWTKAENSEFVQNYIRQRELKYSIGFNMYDLHGLPRIVFAFDRTREQKFTAAECRDLSLAIPLLNNIYKKFYVQETGPSSLKQIAWETTKLTPREIEIANLLCQGVKPANISQALYISLPTTYKHISNIYEKMHVSSRQELLVRLFRQPPAPGKK